MCFTSASTDKVDIFSDCFHLCSTSSAANIKLHCFIVCNETVFHQRYRVSMISHLFAWIKKSFGSWNMYLSHIYLSTITRTTWSGGLVAIKMPLTYSLALCETILPFLKSHKEYADFSLLVSCEYAWKCVQSKSACKITLLRAVSCFRGANQTVFLRRHTLDEIIASINPCCYFTELDSLLCHLQAF